MKAVIGYIQLKRTIHFVILLPGTFLLSTQAAILMTIDMIAHAIIVSSYGVVYTLPPQVISAEISIIGIHDPYRMKHSVALDLVLRSSHVESSSIWIVIPLKEKCSNRAKK